MSQRDLLLPQIVSKIFNHFNKKKKYVLGTICTIGVSHATSSLDSILNCHGLDKNSDVEYKLEGTDSFQLITEYANDNSVLFYDNKLHTIHKNIILWRFAKIKDESLDRVYGRMRPFLWAYALEIGYSKGSIEFINFNYNRNMTSFDSYRKIVQTFPLDWFLYEIVDIKERYKYVSFSNGKAVRAEEALLNHDALRSWKLAERYVSPSEDEYVEKVESALENFHFSDEVGNSVFIDINYFTAQQ